MTLLSILIAYDDDDVKPGWVALIIVLLLALATFLLWRSMNTQLGKIQVPKRGEEPQAVADTTSDAPADPASSGEDGEQGGDRPREG